jgi:hypothetical protein
MRTANPADKSNIPSFTERKRIPMSVPRTKLAVQEIPGYHLHWMLGTPDRLAQAQQAGYTFVEKDEVALNNHSLGSKLTTDGNTDMGSRVSHVAGSEVSSDGQAVRLYLMKIPEEWWQEDQKALEGPDSRLENVRKSLLGGLIGSEGRSAADQALTYMDKKRTQIPKNFLRKGETSS